MKQIENFINATVELVLFMFQNIFKLILAAICLIAFIILILMLLWFAKVCLELLKEKFNEHHHI